MKINAIDCKNTNFKINEIQKASNPYSAQNTISKDCFTKNNKINFTSNSKLPKQDIKWNWEEYDKKIKRKAILERFPRNIDILNGGEAHIKDIASSLCLFSDYDIKQFTRIYNKFLGFSFYSGKKSQKAYKTLMPYIESERRHLTRIQQKKDELEDIEKNGTSDLTDEIIIFNQMFIEPIEIEKLGQSVIIPNSIILYGNSPKNIQSMAQRILNSSYINSKEVKFNQKEPKKSLAILKETFEEAEKSYQKTGKRTIVSLKGYDKFISGEYLSNGDCRSAFEFFRDLTQNCANEYHTTVLVQTKNNPKEFMMYDQLSQDNLAIVSNKHKLTKDEKFMLETYRRTLETRKEMAQEAIDKYTYITTDYEEEVDGTRTQL